MEWECVTEEGKFKEPDLFNLSWLESGVKEFIVYNVDKVYKVDLLSGEFDVNGQKVLPKDQATYKLRFFKRNTVNINTAGKPISHHVAYCMGWVSSNGEEKILRIDETGAQFV
jgi:hypothetical protein